MSEVFDKAHIKRVFEEAARLLASGDPDVRAGRFNPSPIPLTEVKPKRRRPAS